MNYLEQSEEIIVKLLHYFITDKNYNPVILHGAKNEIWLENLDNEYKIIRIVSNYIHNDEQLEYDVLRTKQIMKSIKKKTLSLKVPTLSIFVNLGENVHLDKEKSVDNITCLKVTNLDDVVKNNTILEFFPDINKTLDYKEEGMNLFLKLTSEINKKTEKDAKEAEKIFGPKKPIVTYTLIFINILVFMAMYLFGNGSEDSLTLLTFGANYRPLILEFNQYYRLITSSFLHIGILHLLFNMYALYIIGAQIENFYGKFKYLIIYLGSAIFGSLLSICFHDGISAGASGAIFGLLGAMLYFGYHYRLYLGNVLQSQIIPIIILNLFLGFITPGIDNACHVGGLISGIFLAMACGINKDRKMEKINGVILSIIFLIFILFLIKNINF